MNNIEGVQMGLPSHPSTRVVKKPQPYQRPRTTVSAPTVKREWREVPAQQLAIGDTVPGIGTIDDMRVVGHHVSVAGGLGNTATWRLDQSVYAFTAAADE